MRQIPEKRLSATTISPIMWARHVMDMRRAMTARYSNCKLSSLERTVLVTLHQPRLQLERGDHLSLRNARNTRLYVVSGYAWITVDRDARDIVLAPGESLLLSSDREVVVGALGSTLNLAVHAAVCCAADPVATTMAHARA